MKTRTDLLDQIVIGDCVAVMSEIEPDTFDLVVTSPPYYNARPEYAEWASYAAYLDDMRKWLTALYRVLKPGRRLVWNVSVVSSGTAGEGLAPIPHDSVRIALDVGFVLRSEFFWHYPPRAEHAPIGSFPLGPSVLPLRSTEHILLFQKPNDKMPKYDALTDDLKPYNFMDNDFFKKFVLRQVWEIPPETDKAHPAPFPEGLVEPCLRMWSRPGDLVYDPFMGSGTVAIAAMKWRRYYFGTELSKEYARAAERRITCRMVELSMSQMILPVFIPKVAAQPQPTETQPAMI